MMPLKRSTMNRVIVHVSESSIEIVEGKIETKGGKESGSFGILVS